jgi:DNA-directed RNA polymerase specialized sigma24 family protein
MHNTITQNVGYEIHKNYIKAICYRMLGDADEAEDLTQDVFFRALSRPQKIHNCP